MESFARTLFVNEEGEGQQRQQVPLLKLRNVGVVSLSSSGV